MLRKCKNQGCDVVAITEKDLELFVKIPKCKYGRRERCISCHNKLQKLRNYPNGAKKRLRKGTFKTRSEQDVYRKYKLLPDEHHKMIDSQGNKCLICGSGVDDKRNCGHKRLSIDHCHKTNEVRGLLCMSCNVGIGFLDDNIEALKKAIVYLENPGALLN